MKCRILILFVALASLACGTGGTCGNQLEYSSGSVRGEIKLTKLPLVVHLKLGDQLKRDLRAAIADPDHTTVRLELLGIVPPKQIDSVAGLRVFIGNVKATSDLSDEDPHFTGARVFEPTGNERTLQGFVINITDSISRLLALGDLDDLNEIAVTILPLVAEDSKRSPIDVAPIDISLQEIKVSVRKR